MQVAKTSAWESRTPVRRIEARTRDGAKMPVSPATGDGPFQLREAALGGLRRTPALKCAGYSWNPAGPSPNSRREDCFRDYLWNATLRNVVCSRSSTALRQRR